MSARIYGNESSIAGTGGRLSKKTHAGLKVSDLLVCESIRLGNDGNEVDFGMQLPHKLDIDRFQTVKCVIKVSDSDHTYLRMTRGLNEVKAGMNTIIRNFLAVHAILLLQVRVKTRFNVLDNRFPARIHQVSREEYMTTASHLSSLLTKSPNPGVSTTVRRRRTPFSSISVKSHYSVTTRAGDSRRPHLR